MVKQWPAVLPCSKKGLGSIPVPESACMGSFRVIRLSCTVQNHDHDYVRLIDFFTLSLGVSLCVWFYVFVLQQIGGLSKMYHLSPIDCRI